MAQNWSMNQTIETLLAHRSVRQYTDEPVEPDTVETLIRCAQAASSSSLYQAYTFIQVVDPAQRRALYEASGNQPWVLEAPLLLLCCADLHRAQRNFDVDDKVFGYVEQYTIAVVDAALAAQNLMVAAESLGLGGCFIGGIRNAPDQVIEAFDLPELTFPVFGLCLGRPACRNDSKPRLPLAVVLKRDRYDESDDERLIAEYDQNTREYYLARTDGKESDSWAERCGASLAAKSRPHVGAAVRRQGFLVDPQA